MKVSKADANYRAPVDRKQCHTCTMFVAPDRCTKVMGLISPNGHCKFYNPRKPMTDLQKEAPVAGDVHISSTGKTKTAKPKRRKDGEDNVGEKEFSVGTRITKVDASLGMVFGWAIVCKRDDQEYYDLQGDHIPERAMLEATVDFMQNGALAKEMHSGDGVGTILFSMPWDNDIAESFGVKNPQQTGLMIGMKPSPDVLAKFIDGTYTGFSIGGRRIEDEEVD